MNSEALTSPDQPDFLTLRDPKLLLKASEKKDINEVMMAADASSMRGGGTTSFASSPSSNLLPNNLLLLTAFLAFALAQFLKLFTNWGYSSIHLARFEAKSVSV
ncbi:hypothetical protein ERO13_D08G113108v2 [Gossypium hirsutum]|nr:hypothetical protein ERO13_D08G113108v2 [Gossypium hirsutum]